MEGGGVRGCHAPSPSSCWEVWERHRSPAPQTHSQPQSVHVRKCELFGLVDGEGIPGSTSHHETARGVRGPWISGMIPNWGRRKPFPRLIGDGVPVPKCRALTLPPDASPSSVQDEGSQIEFVWTMKASIYAKVFSMLTNKSRVTT